jgi:hypothetical protein
MVSRQAEELVQRWLEGAEQIKSMPPKAAAALGRRHSLERCLWLRSNIAGGKQSIAGIPMFDALKAEQRILVMYRKVRRLKLH